MEKNEEKTILKIVEILKKKKKKFTERTMSQTEFEG